MRIILSILLGIAALYLLYIGENTWLLVPGFILLFLSIGIGIMGGKSL